MPMPAIPTFPLPWPLLSPASAPSTTSIPGRQSVTPAPPILDRTTGKWSRANAESSHLTSSANGLYIAGPQDFATIYGVNQVWKEGVEGTGQTIGVVGETNLASADIQTFRDQFGITALGPNGSVQMENPPSTVCAAPDPSDNEPEATWTPSGRAPWRRTRPSILSPAEAGCNLRRRFGRSLHHWRSGARATDLSAQHQLRRLRGPAAE